MICTYIAAFIFEFLMQNDAPILYAYLVLPGTILHEGAHYLMALVLQGSPEPFHILPEVLYDDAGQRTAILFGYVMYHGNWYNVSAVGLAPLLIFPIVPACCILAERSKSTSTVVLYLYIALCGWTAYFPSSIDFAGAVESKSSWGPAAVIISISFALSVWLFRKFIIALNVPERHFTDPR